MPCPSKTLTQNHFAQFDMSRALAALSWEQLARLAPAAPDYANGPASAQSRLRLFGRDESAVRVRLFRDHHAWCPYCQKVWLWLEASRVPYRVDKVTMFCYGEKEAWYKRLVPSGMLPALELDGRLVTESDVILETLEAAFGPLGGRGCGMRDAAVAPLRELERALFGAWCEWLCSPSRGAADDARARRRFEDVAATVERALAAHGGPFFLGARLTTPDVVFAPYVERMNASLFYYKGFALRDARARPRLTAWFAAMEAEPLYRGTMSDFHTHSHDLPPQMGGCYASGDDAHERARRIVDLPPAARGVDAADAAAWAPGEASYAEPDDAGALAIARVARHAKTLVAAHGDKAPGGQLDGALRAALTRLATGEPCAPPAGSALALRYVRDRVNVPRDMPLWSARRLREALEATAQLDGDQQPPALPTRHRRDQDPSPFVQRGGGPAWTVA